MIITELSAYISVTPQTAGIYKTHEHHLLEALNASYSHRRGYTIPASKLPLLRALLAQGWSARLRIFHNSPAIFICPDGFEYTLTEAKRALLN